MPLDRAGGARGRQLTVFVLRRGARVPSFSCELKGGCAYQDVRFWGMGVVSARGHYFGLKKRFAEISPLAEIRRWIRKGETIPRIPG